MSVQTTTTAQSLIPREEEYQYMLDQWMPGYFGQADTPESLALDEERKSKLRGLKILEGRVERGNTKPNGTTYDADLERFKQWFVDNPEQLSYEEMLRKAWDEESVARKNYVDATDSAMGQHTDLLTNIIDAQVAGDAVGPYGQDIDTLLEKDRQSELPWKQEMSELLQNDPRVNKLLNERMSVGFGDSAPLQFMTGAQQRTIDSLLGSNTARLDTLSGERKSFLNDLLGSDTTNLKTLTEAQETGLKDITDMSSKRALANMAAPSAEFELFQPSTQAQMGYLEDLWSRIAPNEYFRYALPNSTVVQNNPPTSAQDTSNTINNINSGLNLLNTGLDTVDKISSYL